MFSPKPNTGAGAHNDVGQRFGNLRAALEQSENRCMRYEGQNRHAGSEKRSMYLIMADVKISYNDCDRARTVRSSGGMSPSPVNAVSAATAAAT